MKTWNVKVVSLEIYEGSKELTCRAELEVDSYSALNSCTPSDLSAFMGFMALCWWRQTAQCLLSHVHHWVFFTRNLFMSGFKTKKMVSVSMSEENQRHSHDDNTVSHFTNSTPLCISVILITCSHLVDFMCSLDYSYIEDYPLVFCILSSNSNSWVDTQAMRDTFDIGKNLLAAIIFKCRSVKGFFESLLLLFLFKKAVSEMFQYCWSSLEYVSRLPDLLWSMLQEKQGVFPLIRKKSQACFFKIIILIPIFVNIMLCVS